MCMRARARVVCVQGLGLCSRARVVCVQGLCVLGLGLDRQKKFSNFCVWQCVQVALG